jgi:diacylglycerol O-acyltransferase
MHIAEPLADGCGLNITVTSHADVMDLCLSACPDNVPRVHEIATGIVDAVDTLLVAAAESPRGKGRSVVTEMTSHTTKRLRGLRLAT